MTNPMRQGVLWQPCPTCGAAPGQPCTSLRDGDNVLHNFHPARPDGYDDPDCRNHPEES